MAPDAGSPDEALKILTAKLRDELAMRGMSEENLIMTRLFSSDPTRHAPVISRDWPADLASHTVLIGQPPLDSRYLSLQAWALKGDIDKEILGDGSLFLRHGAYQSLWSIETPGRPGNSEQQTDEILSRLGSRLWRHGMSLESNVIRTWYYMRDVDNNYAGMIKSRVRHYEIHGLKPDTHFIASTGIEGQGANPAALSWVQSHAVSGVRASQIVHLKALDNMSPTAIYGVNFERGTLVTYGDRKHVHISGTASIDRHGDVLYKGDVKAQTRRALENIDALLREGGLDFNDLQSAIVYCRDGHDYAHINEIVREILPGDCAINITKAPVCRPDWLVEIEGEAVREASNPEFGNYL